MDRIHPEKADRIPLPSLEHGHPSSTSSSVCLTRKKKLHALNVRMVDDVKSKYVNVPVYILFSSAQEPRKVRKSPYPL